MWNKVFRYVDQLTSAAVSKHTMKMYFHGYSEGGGVYRILNVKNGRIYIGSTSCFRKRAKSHYIDLKTGRHQNAFMQNDFNKCGEDSFVFEVVERGPVTMTNIKTGESVTIEGSFRGFCTERNLSYKAFHQMISGKIKTSGGWYIGTADNRPEYVSQVGQKRKPLSAEHRNKIAGGKFRGVELLHEPTGEVCKLGDNVKAWALSKGLRYTAVIKVLSGKCKSCGGWARRAVG
jgi:hypothetical protein